MTTIRVVGAAIIRDGKCLVAQRSSAMSLPHKWEFPGGKVEPGEAPEAALAREMREELGLSVEVGRFLGRGTASVGEKLILLDVYAARIVSGTPALREHAGVRWVGEEELAHFDWADADIPVVDAVRRHLAASR